MTNGDKIRQMSDEELMHVLQLSSCEFCTLSPNRCAPGDCYRGINQWLKQEAE